MAKKIHDLIQTGSIKRINGIKKMGNSRRWNYGDDPGASFGAARAIR